MLSIAKIGVKEAVGATAKEAAEAAAKSAARSAAAAATKASIKESVEKGLKLNAAELTKQALATAAKTAGKELTEAQTKEITKSVARAVLKSNVKKTIRAGFAGTATLVKNNPKKMFGALTGAVVLGVAADKLTKLNGKVFVITRIANIDISDGKALKIEFKSEGNKLAIGDTIDIKSSNSVAPSIGTYDIVSVHNKDVNSWIIVNTADGLDESILVITTEATVGEMIYHTSLETQIGGVVGDATKTVVSGVVDVADAALNNLIPESAYAYLDQIKTGVIGFVILIVLYVLYRPVSALFGMVSSSTQVASAQVASAPASVQEASPAPAPVQEAPAPVQVASPI